VKRPASAALAVVALVALATVPAPGLGVPDARMTVSGVTVSPDTVTTGSPVTVTPTVSLSGGSSTPVTVDEVYLLTEEGARLGVATDLGSLSPGGSLQVPLTTDFERAGRYELQVVVEATEDDDETVRVTRPLTVVVEQADPLVELRAPDAVVSLGSELSVRVANPTTAAIRNVEVTVEADGTSEVIDRRTVASLGAGSSANLTFRVRPTQVGSQAVTATVRYTTVTGTRETTSVEGRYRVVELRPDVGVRVERVTQQTGGGGTDLLSQLGLSGLLGGGATAQPAATTGDGGPTSVRVTVTNFGNAPVDDVVLTRRFGDESLARLSVASGEALAPGESGSVVVSLADLRGSGAVTFEAAYRVGGRRLTERATFDYRPEEGSVRVTGVSLSLTEDGRLAISGNAGNTGRADVTGVVVSVGRNAEVAPAYPQRDYFVGTIESSEFAPFDLTADVDVGNATTVPIEVSYLVDGVERTRTVELPFDQSLATTPEADGGGPLDDLPLWAVGAGAAVVLVVAAVALWRRLRRRER
jgi:hypothetical protein